MEGPLLWYVNRSTGVVALVLLTLTTVLGVMALGGRPGRGIPRFVTQAVHRNLALLAVVFLALHVVSAVVDEFVDIGWWDAVVPFRSAYQPLWTGLGTVALDLLLVVVASSLLRSRLGHRGWWSLHLTAYALWLVSMAHGVGMGTDLRDGLSLLTLGCCLAVLLAVAWRLARAGLDQVRPQAQPGQTDHVTTMPIRRVP